MKAPQPITDLLPFAYGWQQPEFAFVERGVLFYQTTAYSNAGGGTHTIFFPVNTGERTLHAHERWEILADDAVRAVESRTVRRNGWSNIDH